MTEIIKNCRRTPCPNEQVNDLDFQGGSTGDAKVPRVQGAGCRVQCSGCRVQGGGWRVEGAGLRVQGTGCRVQGAGCRAPGFPSGSTGDAKVPFVGKNLIRIRGFMINARAQ